MQIKRFKKGASRKLKNSSTGMLREKRQGSQLPGGSNGKRKAVLLSELEVGSRQPSNGSLLAAAWADKEGMP